jgi:hypothetical protein
MKSAALQTIEMAGTDPWLKSGDGHDMESLKALPGSVPQPRFDLSIG